MYCLYAFVVAVVDMADAQEVSEKTVESWCVEEQAMEEDISLLQQVEELERKVVSASLQIKVQGRRHPGLSSTYSIICFLILISYKCVILNCQMTPLRVGCTLSPSQRRRIWSIMSTSSSLPQLRKIKVRKTLIIWRNLLALWCAGPTIPLI